MSAQSRRSFLAGTFPAALTGRAARRNTTTRPNTIVIVTDDQRFDAMSCFEKPTTLGFLKTPNMDRLAAEGVRFHNAFVTTSLCSPSRATMLSGRYVRTHGVNRLELDLKPECRIFPALLRESGYDTGFVGKWHLAAESDVPDPAFDYWAGVRGQGSYMDPVLNINGTRTKTSGYATDIFTDHAIDFVTRKRERPFFLWLAHKAPHSPCTPPKHLERLYDDVEFPLPSTYSEKHDDKPAWFVECHDHDFFHVLLHPRERYQKYVKDYCRSLVSVDENLGRLLKALDETGLSRNTAIFYLADNGHFLGEHQLYSKMLMYEESIRIPMIVRYPEMVPRGTGRDEIVLNVDVAPTVLEMAGIKPPWDMEGRSFKGLAAGRKVRDWRTSFLYEYEYPAWGLPSLEGVRTADGWKYVRFPDWEQLYNLNEDPEEIHNLANDPHSRAKKQQLIAELKRLGGGVRRLQGPHPYKRHSEPKHTPHPSASPPPKSLRSLSPPRR